MRSSTIEKLFHQKGGVFHLVPTWVPRPFNEPGRRLRLHPDDYYAYGMHRGAICERWIGSVTRAQNGPDTGKTEGMSSILIDASTGKTALLRDAVEALGGALIGETLYNKYGTWPAYCKLYDFEKPLFHHLHLTEEKASRIGCHGKPEAYYFPIQYNSYLGRFPLTYFGFDPSTTQEEVKECIRNYAKRDTRITELSRAYRIQLDTGWYTPAGIVHAPASVVTYEPQWNSDVNTILENVTMGEVNPHHMLTDCQPEDEKGDVEAVFNQIDWEENIRTDYRETYFRPPLPLDTAQDGLQEYWIAYANEWVAAKKVEIQPGKTISLKDHACYCALIVQGHGRFGCYPCEAPGLLRFGDISADEYFVSEPSALSGITVTNNSTCEPLVILQNFANNNRAVPV